MSIVYSEKNKEFHLFNDKISYIIKILENNQLGNLYFGKYIKHRDSFEHLFEKAHRPMTSYVFEGDLKFSLEHIKQEYPSYGTTDFKMPAFEIKQENGSRITNFEYKNHRIFMGKEPLRELPATYVESKEEAQTLEITLEDTLIQAELILSYTIFEERGAIARNAFFRSLGGQTLLLENAMSLSLDLPDYDYEMIQLSGAWSRERHVKNRKLEQGIQAVSSLRGASGHNHNSFLAIKRPSGDEFSGEVIGASLVYSGEFLAQIEVDAHSICRLTMGIHPHNFEWVLDPGGEFHTPEAVLVYSDEGLNGMSQTFHELYRTRLARGTWRDKVRPILINNWEATQFNFDEQKILNIAKTAAEYGIEMFVLDDGWFGTRNDDRQGLGDWYANSSKLPNGITGLAKKIEALGLKFGLWFEPEMVNKNSDLFREHPDWIISTPNRRESHGRNQYVLDYSRKEVVDYIFHQMKTLLEEAPISYIKWDMNRNITECYSRAVDGKHQGEVMHRYILGVYDLYERLIQAFPNILFESCASGGGRFDPGMLYYAPQCWTSDDTDAIERIKIQYGTSFVYPISSMGAHVSVVPNHQVYRITPIETRANVAYFGAFGYELDLNELNEEEKEKVREQVRFVKEYRDLIQKGKFYRLLSPFENEKAAWMVVSEDQKTALVAYYKILNDVNSGYSRLQLKGLNNDYLYEIDRLGTSHYGDELMYAAMITTDSSAGQIIDPGVQKECDFSSKIFILKAVDV
ncbi:alpha-galactosidase [Clostridium polyendosporum]|uniref:Alpha-galactosidase n=1 Tax=Clostridium polyendosporum TaxID=69208 RepID=A0A919VGF8_9CLOT|nr:alpha-galactosidase [Clostridium polyendosporum]GIM29147.1 alpha-galactosidase [Clostridium polyendosporum]